MDRTREFYQMCRSDKEIQDYWGTAVWKSPGSSSAQSAIEVGDYIVSVQSDVAYLITGKHPGQSTIEYQIGTEQRFLHDDLVHQVAWLPRQDQIQEMMVGLPWLEFQDFVDGYARRDSTLDRLWLQFFMLKVHKKLWHQGAWVKSVPALTGGSPSLLAPIGAR